MAAGARVIPVTVTAHLAQPAAWSGPILLDAPAFAALHCHLMRQDPETYPPGVSVPAVFDLPLPFARVESGALWWHAVSHALPHGPEVLQHVHRRAPVDAYLAFEVRPGGKPLSKMDGIAGADKALRKPFYLRPAAMVVQWTAVIDPERAAETAELLRVDLCGPALLLHLMQALPSIGRMTGHGHGGVSRWEVTEGGPDVGAYAHDLRLRHLPAESVRELPGPVVRRILRVRAPYYSPTGAVPCLQVAS